MEDIEHYDIPVYNFPYDVEEDDEETIQDNSELRVSVLLIEAALTMLKGLETGSLAFCNNRFRRGDRD